MDNLPSPSEMALKAKDEEIDALCKDTLEPAIYHHAFVVLRTLCKR